MNFVCGWYCLGVCIGVWLGGCFRCFLVCDLDLIMVDGLGLGALLLVVCVGCECVFVWLVFGVSLWLIWVGELFGFLVNVVLLVVWFWCFCVLFGLVGFLVWLVYLLSSLLWLVVVWALFCC